MRHALAIALVIIALPTTPTLAHHSFSAFDMATSKSVTGTVSRVDWTNPHIWIWLDVPNDKGGTDPYAFEGMSPNYLNRRGWTRTTLKVGDKVTVTYRPMRDGKNGGMFMTTRTSDGTTLTMGGGEKDGGK